MHLFHPVSGIKKYSSPEEILGDFFEIRLEYYAKRKEHLIQVLTEKTGVLETKARFIRMVVDGTLIVFKRARKDVEAELLGHKFAKESFEYLWSLKTYQYTGEAIQVSAGLRPGS
jgi:DNA topoisomerase-2